MSLFDLSGRVAVVTGGSRGIGRAIALECAKAGASVVVSSRKLDACEAVVSEIKAAGGKAGAFACNIGHKPSLEALVGHAVQEFGGIDILIPNAAINPAYGPSSETSDEVWNKVLTSNLTATHWLCQMALPGMAERGGGSVILLSSIAATAGSANLGIYAISKAGEAQLARPGRPQRLEKGGMLRRDQFAQARQEGVAVAQLAGAAAAPMVEHRLGPALRRRGVAFEQGDGPAGRRQGQGDAQSGDPRTQHDYALRPGSWHRAFP